MDALRRLSQRATSYDIEMEVLIESCLQGGTVAHARGAVVSANGPARSKMNPVRDTVQICLWSLASCFFRCQGVIEVIPGRRQVSSRF